MLVKFSTIGNGLFLEVTGRDEIDGTERAFRFDAAGNAEYAIVQDVIENGIDHARFFGHIYSYSDFVIA